MIDARASVDQLARLLELVGGAIIIGGVSIAGFLFVHSGLTGRGWRSAYEQCRSNLGRGILLGLELLVEPTSSRPLRLRSQCKASVCWAESSRSETFSAS